jgi:hypothetical protein
MNRGQRRALARNAFRAGHGALWSPIPRGRTVDTGQSRMETVKAGGNLPGSIRLEVEEFALRGFDRVSAHRIAAAFEQEMRSVLERIPLPVLFRSPALISRVSLPGIRIGRPASWRDFAEELAEGIADLKPEPHR